MTMPSFTADASLYESSGHYHVAGTFEQTGRTVHPAQSATCASGGLCYTPQAGFFCNCPPGQQCTRLPCPQYCHLVCFLWWCWTRCERPEVCPADWTCQ
jgi:hypothetical protein